MKLSDAVWVGVTIFFLWFSFAFIPNILAEAFITNSMNTNKIEDPMYPLGMTITIMLVALVIAFLVSPFAMTEGEKHGRRKRRT